MSSDDKNPLARERTDWAEDRTIQANERTFASWMRTGLAAVGMAVALHAIFGKADDTHLAKGASLLFIAIGVAIFARAYVSARRLLKRLNSHASDPISGRAMALTAAALAGASMLVGVLLITL